MTRYSQRSDLQAASTAAWINSHRLAFTVPQGYRSTGAHHATKSRIIAESHEDRMDSAELMGYCYILVDCTLPFTGAEQALEQERSKKSSSTYSNSTMRITHGAR